MAPLRFYLLLILGLLTRTGWAQPAAAPAPPKVQPFLFLEGDWQGAGWIQLGPGQRSEFNQTETVRRKLGGNLLTIEGLGLDKANPQRTIHNAFATVAFEAASNTFRMRAYRADGAYTDALATPAASGQGFVWGFDYPGPGKVRFTIGLDAKGQWHEVGEFSRDGTQWVQNFEMTLHRVAAARP